MRNQTPLVPREPFDVTVHMVLNDFGPLGCAYIETDEAHADESHHHRKHSQVSILIRFG